MALDRDGVMMFVWHAVDTIKIVKTDREGQKMNTLIIYDSEFGNTEQIALTIADMLEKHGPVELIQVPVSGSIAFEGIDLLLCGCPTQRHGLSPNMDALLESLPRGALIGLKAAVFDTRYRMARILSGSAAQLISKRLEKAGATLIMPPESFFVAEREGPLEDGEIERAVKWAGEVVEKVESERYVRK